MKRVGHLYEKVLDRALIREAIIKASRKKRRRKSVRRILDNLDFYVEDIYKMMEAEAFVPSPYRRFTVKDGASQKEREISCPKFYPDQIVHWLLILAIQPVLSKGMYYYTCGSVPGKGAHFGKKYIERWYERDRKGTKYCGKMDIRKYYPSAKAEVIMRELRRVIKCKRTLDLCSIILHSADGLPIGNYTSQWFANFLLQRLDHFIKETLHIRYYVRYMDDMVILGPNKRKLHRAIDAIREYLAGMELTLKGNWQVFKTAARPLDFLGFRFYRDRTVLRKSIALRMRRRVMKIHKAARRRGGAVRPRDAAAVVSYLGWLCHTDSHSFTEKYIRPYIDINIIKEVIRNETRIRERSAYYVDYAA